MNPEIESHNDAGMRPAFGVRRAAGRADRAAFERVSRSIVTGVWMLWNGAAVPMDLQPPAPVGTPSHQAVPPTASEALRRLRGSYRSSVIAERVSISTNEEEAARGDPARTVVVRIFAGVAPNRVDRVLRVDLPDLVIYAISGRVIVTRPSDPTGYVEWLIEGPPTLAALDALLPPLALPQLALAIGDESVTRPTPFGNTESWELKPAGGPEEELAVHLLGTGPEVMTELVFDALADRLAEFTIRSAPGRSGVAVHARCEAIDAGAVRSWAMSPEGRTRVASIAELRAPPSELRVGDVLADLSFQDGQQVGWSLAGATAGARDDDLAVVLLFRPLPEGGGEISPDVAAGIRAMQRCWRQSTLRRAERESREGGPALPRLLLARGVAVFELEAFTREKLARLHSSWTEAVASDAKPDVRPPPGASSLLWTPTGVSSLDRLAPDSRGVLLVIGADRTIRAVVRLDGRARDDATVNAELDEAVK